eukprot:Opistho-2@50979
MSQTNELSNNNGSSSSNNNDNNNTAQHGTNVLASRQCHLDRSADERVDQLNDTFPVIDWTVTAAAWLSSPPEDGTDEHRFPDGISQMVETIQEVSESSIELLRGFLARFWTKYGASFEIYWESLSNAQKRAMIRTVAPGMPEHPGEHRKLSCILVPEMTIRYLLMSSATTKPMSATRQMRAWAESSAKDTRLDCAKYVSKIFHLLQLCPGASLSQAPLSCDHGLFYHVKNGEAFEIHKDVFQTRQHAAVSQLISEMIDDGSLVTRSQWHYIQLWEHMTLSTLAFLAEEYRTTVCGKNARRGLVDSVLVRCANCGKSAATDTKGVRRCPTCRMVPFCSVECFAAKWDAHKLTCTGKESRQMATAGALGVIDTEQATDTDDCGTTADSTPAAHLGEAAPEDPFLTPD